MPELPEVETITRQLKVNIIGKTVSDVKAFTNTLRKPVNLKALKQTACKKKIKDIRRRAKFIIIDFPGNKGILIHLGMTGSMRVCKKSEEILKHDRVSFSLGKIYELRFNDIRKFGLVESFGLTKDEVYPEQLQKFGPEPLSGNFNGEYLFKISRKRNTPIKNFIMDQRYVVGVGNIYASEALFLSHIRPAKKTALLTRKECGTLVKEIKNILKLAIKWGGTTISDYKAVDGSAGKFVQQLKVYGRAKEKCTRCKGVIKRTVIQGRSSFHCPGCQK
ncbi:MAG: bifunctional DNA-formamidopyrimidine glycosylase/DNA-(apurinic or apyrimidinic site) lyase [Planctomycetota bacterium]|jgi:formamidopyrimidine-DNA glycosylase